jgi:hypothetical protein
MSTKVSVIIPSRKERFLQKTIDDVFLHAEEDVEIVVSLDDYWPDPPLKEHPKLIQNHMPVHTGMRGGINQAVALASGTHIMKLDGHCAVSQGFDRILKSVCEDEMIVVPRRLRLEPESWTTIEDGRPPIDYHFLAWPFAEPDNPACGLHGTIWNERAKERAHLLFDEEMSSQGSCYFMKKDYWKKIGPLDDVNYGTFAQEFQEVGLKCWLGGGRVMVCKSVQYQHLHKGKKYGTGYGFSNVMWDKFKAENKLAHDFTIRHWLGNEWKERVHDFAWLIERFNPPGWPADWQEQAKQHLTAKGATA